MISAPIFGALIAATAFATDTQHDALAPAGPQADAIGHLWSLMLAVSTLVWLAVMLAVVVAIVRTPHRRTAEGLAPAGDERPVRRSVYAAVAISTVLLIVLFVASVMTDRALARLPTQGAVHIHLIGHQWWWEAVYEHLDPARRFSTANELHIPVGRPVSLTLDSDDVIHSVWVPNLHGKKDLIPGHTARIDWRADKPGLYRGPCAEFCGYQHALMTLLVVAEPQSQYDAWEAAQRRSADEPTDPQAKRGRDVFVATSCAMCHAIQGTDAQGQHAPDLTHLVSRETIAAGTLQNTPAIRAAWITDPQNFKPGANMPPHALSGEDFNALLAYLATLK